MQLLYQRLTQNDNNNNGVCQVKELVSVELYDRYERLLLQQSLDTMADIVYCPRRACQCPVLIDDNMGTCPSCNHVFCVYCKMTYHGVSPCRLLAGSSFDLYFNKFRHLLVSKKENNTLHLKCCIRF